MRIKIKQFVVTLTFVVCFVLFISMYSMMDNIEETVTQSKQSDDKFLLMKFKDNIQKLQDQLNSNEAKINELKVLLMKATSHNTSSTINKNKTFQKTVSNEGERLLELPKMECLSPKPQTDSKADIQMSEMFEKLTFDNPDGGVWKQGYPISYDSTQWNQTNKLLVFVIPHSHNDPGWIKTFEQYYQDQTSHILNNMLLKLEEFPLMRFVYAEMSFFSMWWKSISYEKRQRVARLLKEKRLEVVTGGWVMTDEATSHYSAMLDQMIEGNQWLNNELGYKPKSGWAIDPFGYSPTMSYLLKRMSFENMLIQRVHYSIKKSFSQSQNLEFFWRQGWDDKGTTDMFCHTMPFYSYDVPHTCGPDPKICCQFDFRRSHGKYSCPWNIQPVAINNGNVEERAFTLLDQYRKKSQLYRENAVLIPLGDDFRYDTTEEWDRQYGNHQRLFNYMNSRKDWNVEAKFSTLSEYFEALKLKDRKNRDTKYPTLSGDFFVYADRDEHYWSGYFTSRPFYKKLDRELEHHQRLAEIIFSLALAESRKVGSESLEESGLAASIVAARRYLGLFQHHDGITGTAKDHVVSDYGNKMMVSVESLKRVILSSAQFLLLKSKDNFKYSDKLIFELDETRENHFDVPVQNVVDLSLGERIVYFYNSLPQSRVTLVTFPVTSAFVEVVDSQENVKVTQIDPIWEDGDVVALSTTNFRLSFVVEVPALGFASYTIRSSVAGFNPLNYLSKLKVFNVKLDESSLGPFMMEPNDNGKQPGIVMENDDIKVIISEETGLCQGYIDKKQGGEQKMEITFVKYGTVKGKDKSGAYLFLPDGSAQTMASEHPDIRLTRGPLFSETVTRLSLVVHTMRLSDQNSGVSGSSLDILNMVDIRSESNAELAMRISTDVTDSNCYFFTDLNGFQVIRRKFYSKLPLQANFYPMTSMAYLENKFRRITLLSAQSLGVASLEPGWLEVMQDRRLNQDDNRGLEQGVLDNKKTPNKFRILFEEKPHFTNMDDQIGFITMRAHYSSLDLLYPVFRLVVSMWSGVLQQSSKDFSSNLMTSYTPLKRPFACDIHLVNLRVMVDRGQENNGVKLIVKPSRSSTLILHRMGFECGFNAARIGVECTSEQTVLTDIFSSFNVKDLQPKSLNLLEDVTFVEDEIPAMELRAYQLTLSPPGHVA